MHKDILEIEKNQTKCTLIESHQQKQQVEQISALVTAENTTHLDGNTLSASIC